MYPKTFTHRADPRSSVVVMNADQEAQLPAEYLPPVTGASGQTISGADHAANVMLSPEYDLLLAEREKLEQDRATFAELVAAAQKDHAADVQALADERAKLTAGYKESMAQLEADRERLNEDWRLFDAAKSGSQPEDPAASDDAAETAAAAAAPAKRVRTAKAE